MATEEELRGLLPKMRYNEEYKKKQKYQYKKRVEAREKEREIVTGKKRPGSKASTTEGAAARTGKSKTDKKTAATKAVKGKGKKARAPKLKVASAETGKETLKKKKARELVKASRAKAQDKKKAAKKEVPSRVKATGTSAVAAAPNAEKPSKKREEGIVLAASAGAATAAASSSPEVKRVLSQAEQDREFIARAIRGDDLLVGNTGDGTGAAAHGAAFIRQDPSLYPDLAFLDDYAEKKHADAVTAEELLQNAHHFFKDLGKRERALNKVAKEHIQHLRAVNRRGGDKDGFRYVVPRNVKQVVRELMSAQKARDGEDDPEALVDTEQLVSTFGGDGVAETSDKPVRRSRRQRSRTYSDFYQFQVSKRWTRNAENFLKRSRPNKILFEAKKHQRSIKKF